MVEGLISIYIIICASLVLFNCAFMLVMGIRKKFESSNVYKVKSRIAEEIKNISEKKEVTQKHLSYLLSNLSSPQVLLNFDRAMDSISEELSSGKYSFSKDKKDKEPHYISAEDGKKYFELYKKSIADIITDLIRFYRSRELTVRTYYVFILAKYKFLRYSKNAMLIATLKDILEEGDMHSCENVLFAIYTIGDAQLTFEIFEIIDKSENFIHPKILSDGLLAYEGNAKALQVLLLEKLKEFSYIMQVNILNYMRFASGEHCEKILDILTDKEVNDEVKFSCMRYFGKYKYEKAYPIIMKYAKPDKNIRTDFAIVAQMVLKNYPGKETMDILLENIHSSNWFIRYNASESLDALGIEYDDVMDIFDGKDRFSREMLQYRFDARHLRKNEETGI